MVQNKLRIHMKTLKLELCELEVDVTTESFLKIFMNVG